MDRSPHSPNTSTRPDGALGSKAKGLVKQFLGLAGAGIAAACCLGVSVILSAVGAAGLGFLIHDAYLFPLFAGFVGLSLWVLYRSAKSHLNMAPFWLSLVGGLLSGTGLWLTVTGVYAGPWAIYLGLAGLVAGSIWDVIPGRKPAACACEVSSPRIERPDMGKRVATGAVLSVAAAAVFYGMYKSVAVFAPKATESDIACWGINSCKGTTACSTAFNACTGQNECRGRGYLYVPVKECAARGGVPLKGSPADPARARS